ncbi:MULTISPECIES: hypothetical protein [unclassified Bradyrhizobium]
MRNIAFVAGALLCLSVWGRDAQAAAVYTDEASWSAAVSHSYSVTIPDPGSAGYAYLGTGDASVIYGGITFSTNASLGNRYFFDVGASYPGFTGAVPVLSVQSSDLSTSDGVTNLLITLPMAITAFALNFGSLDGSDVSVNLLGASVATAGSTFDPSGPHYETADFIGLTNITPFKQILLTTIDPVLNLSQIDFNTPVPAVPETQTWGMLLLGFLATGLFADYRRRRLLSSTQFHREGQCRLG